jgi:hypothetical protein
MTGQLVKKIGNTGNIDADEIILTGVGTGSGIGPNTNGEGTVWFVSGAEISRTGDTYVPLASIIDAKDPTGKILIKKGDLVLSSINSNYGKVLDNIITTATVVRVSCLGSLRVETDFTVPTYLTFETMQEARSFFEQVPPPPEYKIGTHFIIASERMLYKLQ